MLAIATRKLTIIIVAAVDEIVAEAPILDRNDSYGKSWCGIDCVLITCRAVET